jgi:regulator of sirC expression with transglutaminase-like and TPR domain
VLAELDALAEKLRRRIPADAVPVQRLRWLNRFFFQELGFSGNANDYYAASNSYLHKVLETRRGIPITLALLYIDLATQSASSPTASPFPGHFLSRCGCRKVKSSSIRSRAVAFAGGARGDAGTYKRGSPAARSLPSDLSCRRRRRAT